MAESRTMLVTGGSRGLGEAIAAAAAVRGYQVCINYSSNDEAAGAVVARIEAAGGRAFAHKADIADEAAVVAMFDEIARRMGYLDVLVNNAGLSGPYSRVTEMRFDDVQRLFQTNVYGTFLCSREAIRRMSMRGGGRGGSIVNISSASSRLGGAGRNVHYSASKGAINSMSLGLAREVADDGIRVNVVSPGLIDTESQDRKRMAEVVGTIPMKRAGRPEEVAQCVLWLASQEASYVTGAVVDVSGGR
jgi:NAD(P)-dependent dehydrogenase (short-subunit alcohol dehydrogenase family)